MKMKKLLDIAKKPSDMGLFFANFIDEFEKMVCELFMFYEEGPREGYSTTFKSMSLVKPTHYQYTLVIQFNLSPSNLEVFVGDEKPGFGAFNPASYFAEFIDGAVMKALRKTSEMMSKNTK